MSERIPELTHFDDVELDHAFAHLLGELKAQLARVVTQDDAEAFRLDWLGRKQGRLGQISAAWLKAAPPQSKKFVGVGFQRIQADS